MGAKKPWLWLARANWDRCDTLNLSLIITYFFFLSIRPVFTLGYMSKWLLWKSACFGPMSSVNLNNVTVRLGTDGKAYRKISYQVKRRRSRNQEVLAVVPLIRAAVAVLLKWPHGHTHTHTHVNTQCSACTVWLWKNKRTGASELTRRSVCVTAL